MVPDGSAASSNDLRLHEVLAAYLEAEEAGQAPNRAALLARYPDLADELQDFFANRARLASLPDAEQTGALPSNAAEVLAVPDRFGDYQLLGEIAHGGMGIVYRARQLSANREVALKMILTGPQVPASALKRFQIEAEAAASLDHPNIVPIYDVGEVNGQPYFTMKLVLGGSLAGRLHDFCLPSPSGGGPRLSRAELQARYQRIAELLAAVARAVHHAHQRGILHRDLKPANILLAGDGGQRPTTGKAAAPDNDKPGKRNRSTSTTSPRLVPMVSDFGLAKKTDVDTGLTQSNAIIGTARYMAPEQAMPGKERLTTATDVYSLGSVLYELLTGQPPFPGTSFVDTLMRVVHEVPVPPRQRDRRVPPDLATVCLKCLEKEPGQRYGSALELARDLERWRAAEAISLRPLSLGERTWRWARRNRLAALLLATVAVLMVVVTVGSVVSTWRIGVALDEADRSAAEARINAVDAADKALQARQAEAAALLALKAREEALAEKQRLLVANYVGNGTHAVDTGDLFGALVWYGVALRESAGDAAQEEAHRVRLAGVLHRCPRLVQVWFDNETLPAFSPDGSRVILLHKDVARVWRVSTGKPASVPFKHKDEVRRASFSPDDKRLLTVTTGGEAQVWDLSAAAATAPVLLQHGKAVTFAAFSPDGRRIVTAGTDQSARVWGATGGELLAGPFRQSTPLLYAGFSRDSKRLVTCGGDPATKKGEVHVWDLVGGPLPKTLSKGVGRHYSFTTAVVRSAFLTADGNYVIGVGGRRVARLWDLASGREVATLPGVRPQPDGSVSPDGTRVLKLDGSAARVYELATAQAVTPPLLHGGEVLFAAFSPDGRAVVTVGRDRAARVWDAMSGQALTPPLRHGRLVTWAALSADRRLLLTFAEGGIVRVWDVAPRELVQQIPRLGESGPAALSPDGRLAVYVDKDGAARVRDLAKSKDVAGPWQLSGPVTHLAFTPDGKRVLTAAATTALVWDASTGKAVTPVLTHAGGVQQALFTPDGSLAVLKGQGELLQVWDAVTGEAQSRQPLWNRTSWRGLALTADGRAGLAAKSGSHLAEVRDVVSGELRAGPFRHAAAVTSGAFSPDGKRLAVATADGNAVLWNVDSKHSAVPPLQHGSPLRQVAFSADGRRFVTIAEDQTARVWDVATGLPLSPLLRHGVPITAASLSPDGWRLITAGKSGEARAWNLAPDERPLKDLLRLTQLLSGQSLNLTSGAFEPTLIDLRTAWPRIRGLYPQDFRLSAP